MVSPSDVLPFESGMNIWAQHIWIDTAMLGDVICGAWDIFARPPFRIGSLSQPMGSWSPGNFVDLYHRMNLTPLPDERESTHVRRLPNSAGKVTTYVDSNGVRTYSGISQLPAATLCDVRDNLVGWPWIKPDGPPSRLVKLSILGCLPIWFERKQIPVKEAIDAIWRITPSTIWVLVLVEVIGSLDKLFSCTIPECSPVTEAPHIMGAVQNSINVRDPMDGVPDDSPLSNMNRDFRVGGGHRYKDTGKSLEKVVMDAHGWDAINTFSNSVSVGTQRVLQGVVNIG